jgi:hypothetical protein
MTPIDDSLTPTNDPLVLAEVQHSVFVATLDRLWNRMRLCSIEMI